MTNSLHFGKINIDKNNSVVTIAEAAVEHLGSLKVAMRMADSAKKAGADIIKYQMHIPKKEMLEGKIKFWGGSLDEILENYNLSIKDHEFLINYCKEIDIQYLCTPFCPEAVEILDEIGVEAFKTGSGEMMNFPLMEKIAQTKKPAIISTGMSTLEEIEETVSFLKELNSNFMIMNCTSIYPAPYDTVNLKLIPFYEEKFDLLVGHSDHTPDIWTSLGAVSLGAKVIEKHFTLNRELKGPDFEVSLEPNEFQLMVEGIKKINSSLGSVKKIYDKEIEVRNWAHHSIVSISDIPEGALLNEKLIDVKRPGGGIPAKNYKKLINNYKASRNISKDSIIQWEDLQE